MALERFQQCCWSYLLSRAELVYFQVYKPSYERSAKTVFHKHTLVTLGRWYWLRKNHLPTIPLKAIHDAVAVELDHMGWTCDAMRKAWEAEIEGIHKVAEAIVTTKIAD